MLSRSFVALLLSIALVSLVAPSSAEAAQRGRCAVKGSGTLARTSTVRVYRAPRVYGVVYACNYRTNRRFRLGEFGDPGVIRVAGPFVGFVDGTGGSSSGSFTVVSTLNTKTGREQHLASLRSDSRPQQSPSLGDVDESVTDLVQGANGALAWIVEVTTYVECGKDMLGFPTACRSEKTYEVRILGRGHYSRHRVLESGPAIGPDSLARRGDTLRWRSGGKTVVRALR
jgi:hypothetical protein